MGAYYVGTDWLSTAWTGFLLPFPGGDSCDGYAVATRGPQRPGKAGIRLREAPSKPVRAVSEKSAILIPRVGVDHIEERNNG